MDESPRRDMPLRRPPHQRTGAEIPLVQAAMRRRLAERAFEDYVREMARRWEPAAPADRADPGEPLPGV